MTAEIAALNKHAVALASDSAVTISHAGGDKVFNSVNKLFTLSKYAPVGVMVYGEADFMAVPWEPLIKLYRSQLKTKRFESVEDYGQDFSSFLEGHTLFRDAAREARSFRSRVDQFFMLVAAAAGHALPRTGVVSAPTKADIERAIDTAIALYEQQLKALPPLPGLPKGYATARKKLVEEVRDDVFKKVPLTAKQKRRLVSLVNQQFRSSFMPSTSGVVIAGFGEDPSVPT